MISWSSMAFIDCVYSKTKHLRDPILFKIHNVYRSQPRSLTLSLHQNQEIESYQNSARTHLAPNDVMPCGMPLFEKRKTLVLHGDVQDAQNLRLPAMMANRSMDMSDMLESMDMATATTASANASRRASMRSMMSMDFSDDELVEFRDRSNSAAQNGLLRRLSTIKRLAPVNEFNDSEADCDEKTVIVRRPSTAMSTASTFEDEKEDVRRRRGVSAPSSVCDSEDVAMGYDEFTKILRRREDEEGTRRRGVTQGNVKEIRIDISGSTSGRSQRSRSRTSPLALKGSDEDEVDKLLRRLSGQSFNKYRGGSSKAVVAMDPETRDNLKVEILSHIERLKEEYERKQEAEKLAHRRQVSLWEGKYRSLKRDHKKMKNVQRRQKAKDLSVAPNCTFWNWGLQKKGCVPLKQPQHAVKARPYRSGQSKSRKPTKRVPKKRRKRVVSRLVPVSPEKKEQSECKV